MGATTSEIESSHVPMLSKPSLVIDVIRKAADAVQKSKAALRRVGRLIDFGETASTGL